MIHRQGTEDGSSAAPPARVVAPEAGRPQIRSRLRGALEPSPRQGLVWIDGPAGTGKTTLAAAALHEARGHRIWLRLDESDRDRATLFHDLGRAVRAAGLDASAWPPFGPEHAGAEARYVRHALDALARCGAFMLVLDNAETVGEAPGLIELLEQGAAARCGDSSIMVASRDPPPAPLSRLRVEGLLHRIDWDDLRLTREDAYEIARHDGYTVDSSAVEQAYERSGGWLAGFVLLLANCEEGGLPGRTMQPGELLFDYFEHELFADLPDAYRDALMTLWPLPEVTPALADAACGTGTSQRFRELARRHVFVEDAQDAGFRLHALLREFLEHRADTTLTADERAARYCALANALDHDADPEASIPYWLAAGAWARAGTRILGCASELLSHARHEQLRKWIDRLPGDRRTPGTHLHLWRALAEVPVNPQAARADLQDAFAVLKEAGDREAAALAWAGMAESMWLQWGDYGEVAWLVGELDWLAEAGVDELETMAGARLAASALLLLCILQPDHPALRFWARATEAATRADAPPAERLHALHALLLFHVWLWGDAPAAVHVLERGVALEDERDVPPLTRVLWHAGVAGYHFWLTANHDRAYERIARGIACARDHAVHRWDFQLHALEACVALGRRDRERAAYALERMRATVDTTQPTDVSFFAWLAGWAAVQDAEDATAYAHAHEAWRSVPNGPVNARLMSRVCLAHTECRMGAPRTARQLALEVAREARRVGAAMHLWLARLLVARATADLGRPRRAVAFAAAVLEQGRQAGFVRLPWWRDTEVRWLAARAIERGVDPTYVRTLAAANGIDDWQPPVEATEWPWPIRVHALGPLRVQVRDRVVPVGGKGAELLRLLAASEAGVPVADVSDALWPAAEGDRARRALDTTLHRLRRRLETRDAVTLSGGRLRLDPSVCWVDVRALDRHLRRAAEGDLEAWHAALGLARDSGTAASQWPSPAGERLRRNLAAAADHVLDRHLREGRVEAAVDEAERVLEIDSVNERVYQVLLRAAKELGAPALAKETYRRCQAALGGRLGTVPSERTEVLYRAIVP